MKTVKEWLKAKKAQFVPIKATRASHALSVKRLSDNEEFFLGQVVNTGGDEQFFVHTFYNDLIHVELENVERLNGDIVYRSVEINNINKCPNQESIRLFLERVKDDIKKDLKTIKKKSNANNQGMAQGQK